MLDEYGLSRDDFIESLKGFQFIVDKDPNLKGVLQVHYLEYVSYVLLCYVIVSLWLV